MAKGLIIAFIIVVIIAGFLYTTGIWEEILGIFNISLEENYNPRNMDIPDEMTYLVDRAHGNIGILFESSNVFEFGERTFYDNTVAVGTGITSVEFYCENKELCEGYFNRLEVYRNFTAGIKACCPATTYCKVGIGSIDIPCEA